MMQPGSPLIRREGIALLAPQYFGSIAWYAALASYSHVVIDCGMRFDKRRKSVHRCRIAGNDGQLDLTVPISKPVSMTRALWSDIEVSRHGQWWHVHRTALESAYGRTPYFEFYIDRFMPWFDRWGKDEGGPVKLTDMLLALDRQVREALGLTTRVMTSVPEDNALPVTDLRRELPAFEVRPYWQIRRDLLGFMPGLSILDLLFNLGPEAPLMLR